MLPVLRLCGNGQVRSSRELVEAIGDSFRLSTEQRKELLPSGRQPILDNRIGWAKTYLKKAGLLDSPRRGQVVITERGRSVLTENLDRIDITYLERFSEFIEFRDTPRTEHAETSASTVDISPTGTPEKALESAYQELRESLAEEILAKVKECNPDFFELLVVELLVAMGYGGSRKDAGERVGRSGDGGIDGIIKEDRLGLDVIYIQAKRWESSVGRPEVQKFVGALQGQRARKGVFITISLFTRDAIDYAANLESKVILIDGRQLAQLMVDFNIGVTRVSSYEVKRIDNDYFTEE